MPEYRIREATKLKDGEKKTLSAGKKKILVLRHEGVLLAFQAACPHAGAPLEEGAICNRRLVCPWHMGTFRLTDGKLVEPPPMDDLETYPVRETGQEAFVTLSPRRFPSNNEVMRVAPPDRRTFLIVGAGAAGSMAAKTLRDDGFEGELIVVDPVREEPIDRTLLSKMALTESTPLSGVELKAFDGLNVTRIQASVAALSSINNYVVLDNGKKLPFDAALVATGGRPKLLEDVQSGPVYTIRHSDDVRHIRAKAHKNSHAVIVGASFIGLEAASALRQRGLKVTVVGREKLPFENQFGGKIAKTLLSLHKRKGVEFILGGDIVDVSSSEVIVRKGSKQRAVNADLVIVGVGVTPNVDFDHDLPLTRDGAVRTDKTLRGKNQVWIAGDIASVRGVRVEHWRVAQQQGRAAAKQMLGETHPYNGVPFFWTYHFGKRINCLGHATVWDSCSVIGNVREFKFIALFIIRGKVRAIVSCGRESETAMLAEMMRKPLFPAVARLAIHEQSRR